jgi:hypothetical protein
LPTPARLTAEQLQFLKIKGKTMANKNYWLEISVMVLVFGMMFVGCGENTHDYSATLYVKNTASITYYVSNKKNDNGNVSSWYSLQPDRETFYLVFWNEGDASSGIITIYYQSEGRFATYWTTRTYYLSDDERRTVEIP